MTSDRIIARLITFLWIVVIVPTSSFAQTTQTFPSIGLALEAVRQHYDVSVGLDISVSDETKKAPLIIDTSGQDVAHVLDELVGQRSDYTWNLMDGIYDVYPRRAAESLSQLTITSFFLTNATLKEAQAALFNLPEVKQWLSQHRAGRSGLISQSIAMPPRGSPAPEPKTISLNMSNVPLRAILNQVIIKLGKKRWVIARLPGQGEFAENISVEF